MSLLPRAARAHRRAAVVLHRLLERVPSTIALTRTSPDSQRAANYSRAAGRRHQCVSQKLIAAHLLSAWLGLPVSQHSTFRTTRTGRTRTEPSQRGSTKCVTYSVYAALYARGNLLPNCKARRAKSEGGGVSAGPKRTYSLAPGARVHNGAAIAYMPMLPPCALSKSFILLRRALDGPRSRTATHTAAGIGSTSAEIISTASSSRRVFRTAFPEAAQVRLLVTKKSPFLPAPLFLSLTDGHTRKIDRYPSDMRGPQRTTHQSEKGAMGALLPVISSDGAMALPTRRCCRRLCPYSNVRILSRPTVLISTFILGPRSLVCGLFFGSVTQAYVADPSPLTSRRRLAVATASCRGFCIWESVTPGPGRQRKYGVSDARELPPLPVPARAALRAASPASTAHTPSHLKPRLLRPHPPQCRRTPSPKISKLHARLPSPRLSRTPYPCVACPRSPRKHPTMPCYLPAPRSVNHSKCAPSAPWASICIRAEALRWLRPGKRLPRRKWGLSGARALSFPMPSHTLTLTLINLRNAFTAPPRPSSLLPPVPPRPSTPSHTYTLTRPIYGSIS
ncbi:hypothetical protein B0H13DRAFT_2567622 [Mycena leptocephala]|nr:hypothetical protein B0H13DRAFT_2567622 [Mycena leptocephala]